MKEIDKRRKDYFEKMLNKYTTPLCFDDAIIIDSKITKNEIYFKIMTGCFHYNGLPDITNYYWDDVENNNLLIEVTYKDIEMIEFFDSDEDPKEYDFIDSIIQHFDENDGIIECNFKKFTDDKEYAMSHKEYGQPCWEKYLSIKFKCKSYKWKVLGTINNDDYLRIKEEYKRKGIDIDMTT